MATLEFVRTVEWVSLAPSKRRRRLRAATTTAAPGYRKVRLLVTAAQFAPLQHGPLSNAVSARPKSARAHSSWSRV